MLRNSRLFLALSAILLLALTPFALRAQRVARVNIRPLVVAAGDTADHADVVWNGATHGTAVLVAIAYDSVGRLLGGQSVRWTSADNAIATVSGTSANGIVRANGYGDVMITATVGAVTATTWACVGGPGNPMRITVVGPSNLPPGKPGQFTAINSVTGDTIPAPCVHWRLADPSLGTVSRRGVVIGRPLNEP